jgi:hypothetical protein
MALQSCQRLPVGVCACVKQAKLAEDMAANEREGVHGNEPHIFIEGRCFSICAERLLLKKFSYYGNNCVFVMSTNLTSGFCKTTCYAFCEKQCWSGSIYSALSLFPVAPISEHRASVKRFVSFQFLNPKTVSRTLWMGVQPVARPLPIQTQNKHRQTPMHSVGFEPTIPALDRAKTVHVLDSAGTVSGNTDELLRTLIHFKQRSIPIQT